MLRKIVTAVILVPLLVLIVGFAVANRQTVAISFDPFDNLHPAYAVTLPLFAVIFIVLILGVVIGGIAGWVGQGRRRRAGRRLDAEVRALHDEVDSMRRKFAASEPAEKSEPVRPPLILPPTVP